MKFFEYRLYYVQDDDAIGNVRYTIAEDDEHATNNFENIVPISDNKQWRSIERYCPYSDKWLSITIITPTILDHG